MKIAIVHDYLNQYGGAERVVETLHEIFPNAPIYTSVYLPKNLPDSFKKMEIRTSFIQRLPFLNKHFKKYFLIYPFAFRNFNFSEYDIVLSSSSAYAKAIRVQPHTLHICYCHTPARFIWRYNQYMKKEKVNIFIKKFIYYLTFLLRRWDMNSNKKVDFFIANSENVKNRIRDIYNQDSKVIYPLVETNKFFIAPEIQSYFLVVSRLNAYKRLDIAIEAFNKLKLPLRIIGDGPYQKHLESMAKSNIRFLGKVNEKVLIRDYAYCQALIFPGEEDFGMIPVEAQASGRPVIAYAKGGALETVIEGITGIFFKKQAVDSLIGAIRRFERIKNNFDPKKIRENAIRFDKKIFQEKIKSFIKEKYREKFPK